MRMKYEGYTTCGTIGWFLQNSFESSVWRRDEEIARWIHEGGVYDLDVKILLQGFKCRVNT